MACAGCGEYLHRWKKGLLAFEKDVAAVFAEFAVAEGQREVGGDEIGRPAALAIYAAGVLV